LSSEPKKKGKKSTKKEKFPKNKKLPSHGEGGKKDFVSDKSSREINEKKLLLTYSLIN